MERVPRFRFPAGSQCSIYNLPVLNLLKPGETLFITEGCSDCWAMLSSGHKAIAIPSATLLSNKDKELLQSLNSSPKGFLSPDDGGKATGRRALLGNNEGGVKTIEAGKGLQFAMYPDRDAPGERLFLQLKEVLPNLEHHQLPPGCKDYSDYYVRCKK